MDQLSPLVRYVSPRTSLRIQWLRIHLPMQGTWVVSLVWEDPTRRRGVTQSLSPCSRAHELQLLSLLVATTKAQAPGACALQQGSHHKWKPMYHNAEEWPLLSTTAEGPPAAAETQCNQEVKAVYIFFKKKRLFNCHGTQSKLTFLESCIIYTII